MKKKITAKTKRRLFLMFSLTLAILIAFSFNVWKLLSQVIDKNKEAVALKEEIKQLEDEEAYLNVQVEKLNDPDYIARYAREKYLYSKDGEFSIKLPEAQ
jgi:cell division protein DivIC